MKLNHIFNNGKKTVKANSPEILTAFGIVGVGTTAYLTGRASFQAANDIRSDDVEICGEVWPPKELTKRRIKLVWKRYIPAAVSGVVTGACIVGASKANSKRTAAAVSAYSLTERAFSEYREKVVEQLGVNKEQKLRDEIAQDRIDKDEPKNIIITGGGDVLCCEALTGRYFKSDMETLRRAQNTINAKINNERYVNLDEFYDIIGLPYTSQSNMLGWDSDKLMDLIFSTTLSPDGVPCLSFEYSYVKPI